ncbi:MAG TPA: CYTH domain-containing protein [Sunxiuqinia sp.]|nr:CYTH domain-containing protein [Sunxiuqinia sp.]
MSFEIERKFLVNERLLPEADSKIPMVQAYLQADPDRTVRVRIAGEKAYLTIKGRLVGIVRPEFEYEIPVTEAHEMMKMAVWYPVQKIRHLIYQDGKKWEVDFFEALNDGLVLAEIELEYEDEEVSLPPWIISEVTGDIHYHNSYLAQFPFSGWK